MVLATFMEARHIFILKNLENSLSSLNVAYICLASGFYASCCRAVRVQYFRGKRAAEEI